jgi:hypothetical protein
MTNKDLIRQYVDTGLELPSHQIKKLSPNLLKTYLRKRLIVVETVDYKWLSNLEISLLDNDARVLYFTKITPTQLNVYLKNSRVTTFESFLERWNNIVDYISYKITDPDYLHAIAAGLGHAVGNVQDKYDEFIETILMKFLKDDLENNSKLRPIVFSRLINESPTNNNDNLIKILLSNCPVIDSITLDRINKVIINSDILYDAIKNKYIPTYIRANLKEPNIKNIIGNLLLKVPVSIALEVRDELYKYVPESNQDLRDYLNQVRIS